MKKLLSLSLGLLGLLFWALPSSSYAQSSGGFGIRGGVNYNSNGQYFKDAGLAWGSPMDNIGYNLGLFGKANLGPVFIRPELNYTQIRSEINEEIFRTQILDAPLLIGVNVLGPIFSVFAGPAMHYYIQDELRPFDFDKWNAGYQFGIGLNFGNLGIDLRYQRILNGQTIEIDDVFTGAGDFKFQHLTLGLSIKF